MMIGDRGNLLEEFLQTFLLKPLEGFQLDLNEIRHFENGWNPRIAASPYTDI